jgi:cobalamin 5'-phosphate synthase/cobalamin synthase
MHFREYLNEFLALLSFLTVIPTGQGDIMKAASGFYFVPVIGLLEGIIGGLPLLVGKTPLTASLAIALLSLITGFNHIDGYLDFFEAVMSRGADPVMVLKDKHRGSFAIAAGLILFSILISSILSSRVDPFIQLIESSTSAAFSMYVLSLISNPSHEGLGHLFIVASKNKLKVIASLMIYITSIALVSRSIVILLILMMETTIAALIVQFMATKRIGFVNGDAIGFTYELTLMITMATTAFI